MDFHIKHLNVLASLNKAQVEFVNISGFHQ
jgi:hypothetical protein